jgi:hypothetical protein
MRKIFATLIVLIFALNGRSQPAPNTKHILFLGNSYTYVNSLPQILKDFAASAGDTVIFDQNALGSYTLQLHWADATTQAKIQQGGWDFVVLQEQSQIPSFPIDEVDSLCFPYAKKLDSIINIYNPCAETVFYMTWGRKNGDASNCSVWPPVCTYYGMDSLLYLRYLMMADSNNAIVSPVGAAWHYVRDNYPLIELYQTDESHPSPSGSYLAACCFYSVIYRKNPEAVIYTNGLDSSTAANLRHAAKIIVYDSLMKWNAGLYDPHALFNWDINGMQASFTNNSLNAGQYFWNFDNGSTSTDSAPVHSYLSDGIYNVMLIAQHCDQFDTIIQEVTVQLVPVNESLIDEVNIYPQPFSDFLMIENSKGKIKLEIYDIAGRMISSKEISEQVRINTANFNKGIYILSLQNEKENIRIGIIKQ